MVTGMDESLWILWARSHGAICSPFRGGRRTRRVSDLVLGTTKSPGRVWPPERKGRYDCSIPSGDDY